MPIFGSGSLKQVVTTHPDVLRWLMAAIQRYDFSALQGRRTLEEHQKNIAEDTSRSKHSWHVPTEEMLAKAPFEKILVPAVDLAPYINGAPLLNPTPMERRHFYFMAGVLYAVSQELGIPMIWGGAWKGWNAVGFSQFTNKKAFQDLFHWQMLNPVYVIDES